MRQENIDKTIDELLEVTLQLQQRAGAMDINVPAERLLSQGAYIHRTVADQEARDAAARNKAVQ